MTRPTRPPGMDPEQLARVHETLQVGEERLRLFVEQVVDYAMFVLDPSGHVASWNAGAERIKGYKASEIIGQHLSAFYRPEDRWKCAEELAAASQDGRVEDEGWRVRKDGSLFWANVVLTALRDDRGQLVGFAKVTRDLTERRRAEDVIRHSEERFRLLVDSVKDYAFFMLDPSGVIETWNLGAQRIKGYLPHEIIGAHFSRFYPEDVVRSGKCERALATARDDGRFEEEGWRVRKDGSRFWAHVVITAVRSAEGQLLGFAKVTRDLTDRRAAEEARLRLARETVARDAAERSVSLLARLQELTAALAAARTSDELQAILVEQGGSALGATSTLFFRPREGSLELVAAHGASPELAAAFARFGTETQVPAATAYRSRAAQWIESPAEYRLRFPAMPETCPSSGSVAAFPLIVEGRVVGVLGFRFHDARPFGSEERALMHTWVAQAAQALDRADVYAREMATRRRVEMLGSLADALSRALTVDDVAAVIAEHGVHAVGADICTLYALDDDTGFLELIVERGCSADVVELIRRIGPGSNDPFYRTVATRELVWVEDEQQYQALYPLLATVESSARRARASWSAPLVAEGRTIGLLGMGFHQPRRFPQDEREFVTTFSRLCAEALLRARRLEAERAARRRAEKLQASLSTTLRSIGDAVMTTDAAGIITMMNPVSEQLTGWLESEAKGRPLTDVFRIFHEHTRAVVPSPVDNVLEQGTVVGLANHTVLIARDGRAVPIDDSGAPIRRDDGEIEGVVLVFRDVTEKKREQWRASFLADATAALAESLDYEVTLTKVAELAVPPLADWCAVDIVQDGERPKRLAVAHVDARKVQLVRELGAKYPPADDAADGVANVLRSGRSELHREIPEGLLVSRCDNEGHAALVRALGPRSALVVPLVSRGRALGAMTFAFAESGRRYAEDDLRFAEELARRCSFAIENSRLYASAQRARRTADVANRAKDEFLAVVSHELRTPLNAILGWSKMMSSPTFDEARRARAMDTIERNAVAMAQLIEDLLDMSRIISGKLRLEVQQVDLAHVVEAAIDSIKPAADAKNVAVVGSLDATVPPVTGDPTRLQQVVWNLLSNAVKFTPNNGSVEVVLRRNAAWIEVCVKDTGAGIAPKFLPHVFDAFRQQDATYTRSRGGLGLGLAIAKQLVEAHGGRVEAESDGEGRGANFKVSLPVTAPARSEPPIRAATRRFQTGDAFERPAQLRGLRVLVVDDEEDARQLVKAILEDCGCRVTLASSVDHAIAAMARELPDLLLSDIAMPERDGYHLIRHVRALPLEGGGDVPAAALTAYALAEDRRRMLDAGYSMHVSKPVEPAELVAVVASLTRFMQRARMSS